MKMMIAFRWTRTPTTPMMKSAAVSASDSASTGGPPPAKYDGASDRHQQQNARELECQQIILEQGLGDGAHRIQLLELLLVEVARHDELLGQLGAEDHHDLAQEAKPDEPGGELPARPACVGELRWMAEIEQHDHEQEHHHDRACVHEYLHHADELRIQHYVQGGKAEHRVDQPQRRRDGTLARDESDRRSERDDAEKVEVEDVKERVVRLHHCPFGSSGSHISQTGCVWSIRRCRS